MPRTVLRELVERFPTVPVASAGSVADAFTEPPTAKGVRWPEKGTFAGRVARATFLAFGCVAMVQPHALLCTHSARVNHCTALTLCDHVTKRGSSARRPSHDGAEYFAFAHGKHDHHMPAHNFSPCQCDPHAPTRVHCRMHLPTTMHTVRDSLTSPSVCA